MPSFQSPVPISGRPCAPVARLRSRPRAQCSNSGARLVGLAGLEVEIVLALAQRRPIEEGHRLVEDRGIAGGLDIVRGDGGEPRAVVGDARAHALARDREPPMLDVALDELSRRRAQDVGARQRRHRHAQATSHPGAGRGSRRHRSPDRRPSAPSSGRPATDRAASRSAGCRSRGSGVFTCTVPSTPSQKPTTSRCTAARSAIR